ncbi:hypothetical protein BV898_19735, partial [Hypsibius exemplaris]
MIWGGTLNRFFLWCLHIRSLVVGFDFKSSPQFCVNMSVMENIHAPLAAPLIVGLGSRYWVAVFKLPAEVYWHSTADVFLSTNIATFARQSGYASAIALRARLLLKQDRILLVVQLGSAPGLRSCYHSCAIPL